MEFTIRVPELAKALQRVQGIVEKKTTMPILANVLISSKGKDAVSVSATDLEIGLTADYEAKVPRSGAMTLNAKALYDIVKALPEATVTLKSDTNAWVQISCGKVKYRVVGDAPESFPSLPKFEDVPFFAIDAASMRSALDKALPSVSTDETRFNLTGILLERGTTDTDTVRFVSTDGHRLAAIERKMAGAMISDNAIIPRKGVMEMRKLLDGGDAETRLGFSGNSAVLERNGVNFTMRLVDGKFPEYQAVIPSGAAFRVTLDRLPMLAAIKRVALLSPDKGAGMVFHLVPSTGTITLKANNPDLGEASEEVEVTFAEEALPAKEMRYGLNAHYVLDALGSLSGEKVTISLSDELSPCIVRGEAADEIVVLMPMRVA